MQSLKPILLFAAKFFGSYIFLIILVIFTGFNKSHAEWFANRCDSIFENFFDAAQIHSNVISSPNTKSRNDVQLRIFSQQIIKKARTEAKAKGQKNVDIDGVLWSFNSQRTVLMPLLFLLALIIAYPVTWKRKLVPTAIALGLFFLFWFLMMTGVLMLKMHQDTQFFSDYQLPNFFAGFIYNLLYSLVETSFLIMFLIWGITMIRVEDFKQLIK